MLITWNTQQKKEKEKNIFHLWELFSMLGVGIEKLQRKLQQNFFGASHFHIFYVMYVPCTQSHTYTAHLCYFFSFLPPPCSHTQHIQHNISDVSHTTKPSDKFCFFYYFILFFICLCVWVCHVWMYWWLGCVGCQYEDICGCVWMCVNPLMNGTDGMFWAMIHNVCNCWNWIFIFLNLFFHI